jgi:diaminopimelate epimerase
MNIRFFKMHGTGNDFLMIENWAKNIKLNTETIALLCDRHFGIGADGLILIEESDSADFQMKYFNSDGKEGSMCGNGGRCSIAFAADLGLIKNETTFLAADGLHKGEIAGGENPVWTVKLKMSDVDLPFKNKQGFVLNTGSPHLVVFCDDNSKTDVFALGREIRFSDDFRETGINVNFVTVQSDHIHVRTYERGVEQETLSCGTGVTAAAIVSAMQFPQFDNRVNIQTKGGNLSVEFVREKDKITDVWLEGPVTLVFSGEIQI